ncbi:MAG: hypothetical protein HYX24_01225 [Candidatus Aenigmarchaeota archaeon]|nr:hypothetical protein [Candidatus Aenigmarchaeota archaeon]
MADEAYTRLAYGTKEQERKLFDSQMEMLERAASGSWEGCKLRTNQGPIISPEHGDEIKACVSKLLAEEIIDSAFILDEEEVGRLVRACRTIEEKPIVHLKKKT